jgi:two-component system response regulator FlrC
MPHSARRKRVVIVDDEVAIGHMLAACCDMWGMEGIVTSTADEALAVMAERTPDLVVSDFMMPGMNGHELLRRVRGDRRFRGVPLILMSAVPETAAQNSPADAFLAKPLDLDLTEKTLHRWIDQTPAPRRRGR